MGDEQLHIGVDLDNTVLDATSSHLKYYNIASGLTLTPDDVDDYFLYRLYGWDKLKADAVYREYGRQIHWESGRPVILYEQPYNLSVVANSIFRASNWLEVERHINQLQIKKGTGH